MFCFILFKSSSIHLSEFNYKLVTDEFTLLFLFFFMKRVDMEIILNVGFVGFTFSLSVFKVLTCRSIKN